MNWKPVIVFYVKTTSWIVLPLVVGLLAGRFTESQALFFIFLIIGFGLACFDGLGFDGISNTDAGVSIGI